MCFSPALGIMGVLEAGNNGVFQWKYGVVMSLRSPCRNKNGDKLRFVDHR